MARVHQRKARKDYPSHGIKKGDDYYFAQIKTGPRSSRTLRSLTPFKRSQLTTSAFLGGLYDFEDSLDAAPRDESLPDTLRSLAEEIRSLGQEEQDKFDNMPENFQQGDTGQMLEERAQNCESWADEMEQAADELETKIEEINNKEAADLDDLDYDPEDEDAEAPSDEAVEEARAKEREDAYDEAFEAATSANPF